MTWGELIDQRQAEAEQDDTPTVLEMLIHWVTWDDKYGTGCVCGGVFAGPCLNCRSKQAITKEVGHTNWEATP